MHNVHSLLVNSTYEPLGFASKKRAVKLLAKNKVDVVDTWENISLTFGSGKIAFPSIIRLKQRVPVIKKNPRFQRETLFQRDNWTCQYCNIRLQGKAATIDHLIPYAKCGKTNWLNCVTACSACNKRKGSKVLTELDMHLKKQPTIPNELHIWQADVKGNWNEAWDVYIKSR